MDRKTAKNIHNLIVDYQNTQSSAPFIDDSLAPGTLGDFHQWADSKEFEGGFLIRNQNGKKIWLLLTEWTSPLMGDPNCPNAPIFYGVMMKTKNLLYQSF